MKSPSHETHTFRALALSFFATSFLLLVAKANPPAAEKLTARCQGLTIEEPAKTIGIKKSAQSADPSKLYTITGRVVDPNNRPVKGAQVRVLRRPAVLTDRRGEFNIRGLDRSERLPVSFSAPDFMDTTRIYKVGGSSRITANVVVI